MLKMLLKILGGLVAFLILVIAGAAIYVTATWDRNFNLTHPVAQITATADSASLVRGEFLHNYSLTCWMCHAPGDDPMKKGAGTASSGGMLFDLSKVGPGFGKFYAKNITPDSATGIGAWSDGEIVRAIREGVGRDGKPLIIMPSQVYKGLSDGDVSALVAYLRSVPAVKNQVPPKELSFFSKALLSFKLFKPQPSITAPVVAPPAGPTAEYGAYLAKSASLCNDCHTPFNMKTGTPFFDSLLAGGSMPFGEVEGYPYWLYAPNLTPDKETGIGNLTEDQFLEILRTGTKPDGKVLLNLMPYAYYGAWPEDDLRAVYRFLQTVKPMTRVTPPAHYTESFASGDAAKRGQNLYHARCIMCHGDKGMGAAPTKLKLAEVSASLTDDELKQQIAVGTPSLRMPSFEKTLTAEQIGDVVAFIRSVEVKQAP